MAGLGVVKGASTFGQIGSVAAITAESSDLSEQRRYLLDRYYDLPEGPEGDREAAAIQQELIKRGSDAQKQPPHFFHWKSVAVCALLGAGLALAFLSPLGLGLMAGEAAIQATALKLGISTLVSQGALTAGGMALGALAGGLTGATIGIDRYYIRKWFDHTQDIVHSSSHKESALIERAQQVERLKAASKVDEKTKSQMFASPLGFTGAEGAEKPTHHISQARREGLAAIQKAMEAPTV
jgi:hypothetical protein